MGSGKGQQKRVNNVMQAKRSIREVITPEFIAFPFAKDIDHQKKFRLLEKDCPEVKVFYDAPIFMRQLQASWALEIFGRKRRPDSEWTIDLTRDNEEEVYNDLANFIENNPREAVTALNALMELPYVKGFYYHNPGNTIINNADLHEFNLNIFNLSTPSPVRFINCDLRKATIPFDVYSPKFVFDKCDLTDVNWVDRQEMPVILHKMVDEKDSILNNYTRNIVIDDGGGWYEPNMEQLYFHNEKLIEKKQEKIKKDNLRKEKKASSQDVSF